MVAWKGREVVLCRVPTLEYQVCTGKSLLHAPNRSTRPRLVVKDKETSWRFMQVNDRGCCGKDAIQFREVARPPSQLYNSAHVPKTVPSWQQYLEYIRRAGSQVHVPNTWTPWLILMQPQWGHIPPLSLELAATLSPWGLISCWLS